MLHLGKNSLVSSKLDSNGLERVSRSWSACPLSIDTLTSPFSLFCSTVDIIVANAGISEKIDDANSADIFPVVEQDRKSLALC